MTTHTGVMIAGGSDSTYVAGRYADLFACVGNPLEDITCLQDPSFVMKGGCVAVDKLANASASPR
jgi:hypothetical protein